jgi:spore maturation protein CgeB
MSKKFPELHTTRTMEIPACGTILATQRTSETGRFYNDSEALFFDNFEDLSQKVNAIFSDPQKAQSLAEQGRRAVLRQPFSYPEIMANCLKQVGIEACVGKTDEK